VEIDQYKRSRKLPKTEPNSRRMVVSAWNASVLSATGARSLHFSVRIRQMAKRIAPCHGILQCFMLPDGKIARHYDQRSADIFLGVCPSNIASSA